MTDEPVSATPSPALAYMQALDTLSPMTEQLDAFGVLRGAWRAGVVHAASYAEQHEQFQRGGRYLELGCGAAGMCNTILQIYPALEAVGIELSDILAAKARERAEAVGVADRFNVICGDVRDFDEPDSTPSSGVSPAGRTYALDRVVHGGWGVPARGVDDLEAELVEAGFVDTEFQDVGFARIVAARKPSRPTS